jgi:hypothetical protein
MNFKINHFKKSLLFINPLLSPFPRLHFHAILMRRRRRRRRKRRMRRKDKV